MKGSRFSLVSVFLVGMSLIMTGICLQAVSNVLISVQQRPYDLPLEVLEDIIQTHKHLKNSGVQTCDYNHSTSNDSESVSGLPSSDETTTTAATTDPPQLWKEWYDFEEFIQYNKTARPDSPLVPPNESEWLLFGDGDRPRFFTGGMGGSRQIPRRIFKVNIMDDGYLEPVFERGSSMLRRGNREDRRIVNLQEAHLSWKRLNPGYTIKYFDLEACRQYLKHYFHPVFLRTFDCLEAYAGKVNLFRYLVVYREGGWYSDWKQTCLVDHLLDELGANGTTWFSAKSASWPTVAHQNAFFGAPPRHPVLRIAIEKVLKNVQSEFYNFTVYHTSGIMVLGSSLKEVNAFNEDMSRGVKIGRYVDRFKMFFYNDQEIVRHKCKDCGMNREWKGGNDYSIKFKTSEYYCPDAKSIFRAQE